MRATTNTSGLCAHSVARFLYWGSLLLLLAGMWALVDPLHRIGGRTGHLYLTVGAFDLYIWLLLVLGRWQARRGLVADAARSGVFAAVLSGLMFVAINEFHMASAGAARWVSALAAVSTIARLLAASRWLGFPLPAGHLAACCGWVAALAAPGIVLRWFLSDRPAQHLVGYLACWGVAGLAACHLPLVAWQRRRGWHGDGRPLGRWFTPWVLLGILAAVTVLQLHAVMWGLFVYWAQWYFTPIFLAGGVVAVSLGAARGRGRTAAWMFLGMAVLHAAVAWQDRVPILLPLPRPQSAAAYAVHPIYPSGAFLCLLFVGSGLLLRRLGLFSLSLVPPAVDGITRTVQAMWTWPRAKGVLMLLGAFALLGAGAAVQWWQEQRRSARPAPLWDLGLRDRAPGAAGHPGPAVSDNPPAPPSKSEPPGQEA